ncbi:2-dehydropantoate 2-reductase [Methanoculleus chikugoensis]|jgi:2-dehydropantoate 2-reductase|uniref:2-dehydropantoate 2-reductase n=1 Tax=Methanoculleus chikugoensis TaxID=118126 RepID=A0A1M4MJ79_9EURY|nr:ketopantoate reductase family protein [Methanoculleus chikugoensis]MDD4567354.1 ketopantoate reductase family protein [Methanoculleus chikugoensis]NMA11382.1 ketopantoate reductase family protein [Methanomicrobiales archaeon]SCL74926.1 2-dehydropantoate 2-reductase [Methanoculleus chikugoensis]
MESLQRPVILILGAGAVGLSLAGRLAAVATVYAACRPVHADAIRERGLVMEGIWGNGTVGGIIPVTGPDEVTVGVDFVIVTAKGTATRTISREYAGAIRGRPTASLQNGIGNEDIIAEYTDTVIGGTVTTNFSIPGPGHVRVLSESAPMRLGLWSGGDGENLRQLIGIVRSAGIAVEAEPDIRAGKWAKALLNIAVNPICALLRAPVGVAADEEIRGIVDGLVRETFAVAGAEGVRLPWATADDYLAYLFRVQVPDFAAVYPSMYHDLRLGRRTEIDLLNGYVATLGERHGIATPHNQCIAGLVRYAEAHPDGR